MEANKKQVEHLIVDTTAFIQNAPLQNVADNIITCSEVVNEITSKRQLRRLVVLPYDLSMKEVFPENIQIVTDFAKKTGDYVSLSATDIKVIALTYQLEKEHVGIEHLRKEPLVQKTVTTNTVPDMNADVTGFFKPKHEETDDISEKFEDLDVNNEDLDKILEPAQSNDGNESEEESSEESNEEEDDDSGWITPSNIELAKKQVHSELIEDKHVKVACMTTDFAMQNVLKQMNLNVCALDGRVIKQLRTFILRCYTCFKTTSIMTKRFCPKCGNDTLKKVAVSLDDEGKMQIHINARKPLTARGKKYSLPRIQGGKHPNNPILVEDQPMPDNRPSRLARTKNNPLNEDYIAGFSPFIMRDVNSKSAQLGLRPGAEFKQWMRKNPNEVRRRRK